MKCPERNDTDTDKTQTEQDIHDATLHDAATDHPDGWSK